MATFWNAKEAKPVEMLPGVTRRVISCGERVLAVRVEMVGGSTIPPHNHPHEQIGFVASGRVRFTIGDSTALLEAGDGYSIPSGVAHSVDVLEDSVAVDIFSPVREEYLS